MSGGRLPAAPRAHSTQAKPPRRRDEHTAALASPGARSTITYERPRRALAGLPHLAAAATQSKVSTRADIRVSQPTQPSVSLAVAVPPQCDRLCRIFTGAPATSSNPATISFRTLSGIQGIVAPRVRWVTRAHSAPPDEASSPSDSSCSRRSRAAQRGELHRRSSRWQQSGIPYAYVHPAGPFCPPSPPLQLLLA